MIPYGSEPPATRWRARRVGNFHGPAAAPWDGLLIATAIMILTYVWRIQQLYEVFRTVPVTRLATLAAVAFLVLGTDPRRTLARTLKSRVMYLMLALAGLIVLRVPTGVDPSGSYLFIRRDYSTTFLLLVLVAASIRTVRDVERLVLVHLVGAVVYATWILTHVSVGAQGRLGGLAYYDANDISLLLAGTIPFAILFLRQSIPLAVRLASLSALILFMVVILQAGSRGGFLAVVAVMLYVLVRFRAIPARIRVVSAIAGVSTMLMLGSDQYWTRMQSILHPTQDYNWVGGSSVGRGEIWKRGMGYMVSRPFGIGVHQFAVAEGFSEESLRRQEAGVGFKWSAPHSSFVQIGAELGVLGLVVFVLVLANAIKAMASLPPPPSASAMEARAAPALGQALVATLIAFVVAGAFLTHGYSAYLYSILGMVIGMQKLVAMTPNTASPRSRRRSTGGYRSRASNPLAAR